MVIKDRDPVYWFVRKQLSPAILIVPNGTVYLVDSGMITNAYSPLLREFYERIGLTHGGYKQNVVTQLRQLIRDHYEKTRPKIQRWTILWTL